MHWLEQMRRIVPRLVALAVGLGGWTLAAAEAASFTALLETGGAWDLSSPAVQSVFESASFRAAVPVEVAFEVWSDTAKPKVRTVRYPALFLRDAQGRVILRDENLPCDITPERLAARIAPALAAYCEATNLFAQAYATTNDLCAAELFGRGFAALDPHVPGMVERWVLKEQDTSRGNASFAAEWQALRKRDPKDATGWQARFTMGDGYEEVRRVDLATKNGTLEKGLAVAKAFRARQRDFWTATQRQAVEMAEFAAYRRCGENPARQRELLEKAVALGSDTIWGAAARGYLEIAANPEAKVTLKPSAVADLAHPDVAAFRARLAANGAWRDEFDCAGAVRNRDVAITNLATFVANCGGEEILTNTPMRRLAMATALNCLKRPIGEQVAMIRAYRQILDRGRLHHAALGQSVYDWRLVVANGHDAGELLLANALVNCPREQLGEAHEIVPYNMYNCFGEFAHNGAYYRPWFLCGWLPERVALAVGGVCVAQSQTAVLFHAAHGLPAVACSQPGHCAYAVDDGTGSWKIRNPIGLGTVPKFRVGDLYGFANLDVQSRLYSTEFNRTLASTRLLEKGDFPGATAASPLNFVAWRAWWGDLKARNASAEEKRAWADGACAALADARDYYWSVLTPYVEDLATRSPREAADALVRLYQGYRIDRVRIAEEMTFDSILQRQRRIFKRHPAEMLDVYRAALKCAAADRRVFTSVLKSGESFVKENPDLSSAFYAAVRGESREGLDYSAMIRGASASRNLAVFREAVALQDAAKPAKRPGTPFPDTCQGGRLVSAEGMLTTSSAHPKLDFPATYARAIDATPLARSYAPFYTKPEHEAWALVTLPQEVELTAIRLNNSFLPRNRPRQLPLEVLVSADGEAWEKVARFDQAEKEYAVDLAERALRARYVKVMRLADGTGKKRPFALQKILVYGKD